MEPVTVTGVTAITIVAPASATITVSDNGDPLDGTFLVDFHGGGETHAITGAGSVVSITLQLGSGTNNVIIDVFDVAFDGSFTVQGGSGDDTLIFVAATAGVAYTFDGSGGTDTLVGPNLPNTWTIGSAGGGDLNDNVDFTGVERLTGGELADTFVIKPGGSATGIDGGDAVLDVIDMSALTTAVTVNGETSAITGGTTINLFEDIAVIVGTAAGTDTIVGLTAGTTFLVTGVDAGFVDDAFAFSSFERLTGTIAEDEFILLPGASISGTIDGAGGTDTLQGPDDSTTWVLTGANAGVVITTDFVNVERLVGGVANDRFRIESGGSIGEIDGGEFEVLAPSTDTLDLSALTGPATVNLAAGTAPGVASFLRIDLVLGTAHTGDTLVGPTATRDQVRWDITSLNSGTVEGITFDRFENLTGQASTDDAFVFANGGRVTGTINGGVGGTDGFAVLVQTASGPVLRAVHPATVDAGGTLASFQGIAITYAGMDPFTPVGGTTTHRLITGSVFDAVFEVEDSTTVGSLVVTFEGLEISTNGTSFVSSYTFDRPTTSLTVTAGTGLDSATVANLSPAFGGSVIVYSAGVITVTGTANADTVVLALVAESDNGAPIASVTVNGLARTFGVAGGGVGSMFVHAQGGDDDVTIADLMFAPITVYGGEGDEDKLRGPDEDLIWTITGENAGASGAFIRFEGIENLYGGTGADGFLMVGSLLGTVGLDGGGGIDTLAGPDVVNVWTVTGIGSGAVNANTPTPTKFAAIERLIGGSDDDRFDIGSAGQMSFISGGLVTPVSNWTSDQLIPQLTTGQTVRWVGSALSPSLPSGTIFKYTGADITTPLNLSTVAYDTDPNWQVFTVVEKVNELNFADAAAPVTVNLQTGTAGVVASFENINKVVGRTGGLDTLIGPTARLDQTVWRITGTNVGTVDGVAFSGFENLTGQAATNDAFVFASGGSITGTIAGGAGALDGFAVEVGVNLRVFQPAGVDSTGGPVAFEGVTVTYTGMDAFNPFGGTTDDRVINGTIFDRDATLTLSGSTLTLTFVDVSFGTPANSTFSVRGADGLAVAGHRHRWRRDHDHHRSGLTP